ncbi:ferrous iron transport protein B [Dehalogenimonas sp. WBC-2]|nr:ferrous iron transport protein B [Dehalogenimonas sp. WBC-2]
MDKKKIRVALAGNPNSGKTTLFNRLTGSKQHVGNWPGVTVEKKEGRLKYSGYELEIVDLPGVYSLTAHSLDEIVTRNYIIDEKPDVVVNIIDASNLERNLYLTVQLMEMEIPFIIALNMMDEVESRKYKIDVEGLSREMNTPVVAMIATKGQGIDELLKEVLETSSNKERSYGVRINYGREIETQVDRLEAVIQENGHTSYSPRWLALKLIEGDPEVIKQFEGIKYG